MSWHPHGCELQLPCNTGTIKIAIFTCHQKNQHNVHNISKMVSKCGKFYLIFMVVHVDIAHFDLLNKSASTA